MHYAHYIKEIGRGAEGSRSLSYEEARELYAAMLDGGVPDLELGAIAIALRVKGESLDEMLGFFDAARDRTHALKAPNGRARPVVLPTYNGSRKEANLTPLLALLLKRIGVPVLVHGLLEGYGRVTTAQVFRELGVTPSITPTQAQIALDEKGLAFVPTATLSPGFANLLALRSRLGVRNSAHSLVKMLDPFHGQGLLVAPATHPAFIELMRDMLLAEGLPSLLLRGTEGEPFANPKRRPKIEYLHDGVAEMLFDAEHDSLKALPNLPETNDAASTAKWTRGVLESHIPLPVPIANQLACCLYASGYVDDFNQAKAIVAIEANAMPAVAAHA